MLNNVISSTPQVTFPPIMGGSGIIIEEVNGVLVFSSSIAVGSGVIGPQGPAGPQGPIGP